MIISKHRQLSVVACTLFTALLLSACGDDNKPASERKRQPHLVEVVPAQIQAVRTQLTTSGSLKARKNVRVYNEISARIVSLPHYPGDKIKQGDLLVKLDDSLIRAELDKAVAQKQQATSDFERLKKLGPGKLATADEITRAETSLQIATAEEKLQRARLALTRIRAPFDGVVTARLVEPGDVVAMHSHILTVIDPDSLHLVVQLAERWMPFINSGDYVAVSINALGSQPHDGMIDRIYPGINETTRKGTLEISLEPQPFGAQPGQLATADFYTRSVDRLVVPAHSLHHDAEGAYVFTLDDEDRASKAHIIKGEQYGDLIAVDSGLSANSRVVSRGFIGLRNDKQVEVINANRTAKADSEQ